jgi:uncharacterized membrane protein SirB2
MQMMGVRIYPRSFREYVRAEFWTMWWKLTKTLLVYYGVGIVISFVVLLFSDAVLWRLWIISQLAMLSIYVGTIAVGVLIGLRLRYRTFSSRPARLHFHGAAVRRTFTANKK